MRSALFFSLVAMMFYATEIWITDIKLGNVSWRLLVVLYSGGVAVCGTLFLLAGLLLFNMEPLVWPQDKEWRWVALMIGASVIAASGHFIALNLHAGAVTMCTFYCLLPVTASFLDYFFGRGEKPSWMLLTAWVLAICAVLLVMVDKARCVEQHKAAIGAQSTLSP